MNGCPSTGYGAMKMFISWSGERSQALGKALHDWLPMVLHYVDPWLSHSDIDAGQRWADVVGKELEIRNFGIICVTRENVASPWMLFEAGALTKFMQEGRVIPLLFDIEFKDITGPLAQFQAKKVEQSGLLDVINSINSFSETKLPDSRLNPLFETLWPSLEKKISAIQKAPAHAKQNRPQHEILEELVSGIRGLDVRFRESFEDSPRIRRKRQRYHPEMIMDMLSEIDHDERCSIQLIMIASYMKDDFPWIYELGLEAYRESLHRKSNDAQCRFFSAIKSLRRGPFMEMMGDKESYMLIRELEHLTEKFGMGSINSTSGRERASSKKMPPAET
jgi:hypothetical protein